MSTLKDLIKIAQGDHLLNKFLADKLASSFEEDSLQFRSCLKLAKLFFDAGVRNQEEFEVALGVWKILHSAYGRADSDLFKYAFSLRNSMNLENINDYYYLVLRAVMEKRTLKKEAYPNAFGALSDEPPGQYDLDKWAGLVHKIYDAVILNDMSYENAVDYYAGYLDRNVGEDIKFKKWLAYYKTGENMKYSEEEQRKMKKEAYQFAPSGIDFYIPDTKPIEDEIVDAQDQAFRKKKYEGWKNKLHSAIRKMDRLLRNEDFVEPEKYEELMNLLHNLDISVGRVRLQATASDLTYQTANKIQKLGFNKFSDELIKIAQAAPPTDPGPIEDEEPPVEMAEAPVGPAPTAPAAPTPEGQQPPAPEPEIEPVELSDIPTPSGAKPGEYDFLAGGVTLEMASKKLEEVAGLLADRRSARLLSEFDIMLDQLGIATMFPELPEAQTKIMEAHSYALTRVTRMLGMLSGGRTLLEDKMHGGKTPGVPEGEVEPIGDMKPVVGPEGSIEKEFEGEVQPDGNIPPIEPTIEPMAPEKPIAPPKG